LQKTLVRKFKDDLFAPLRLTVLSDEICARLGVTSVNAERIDCALQFVEGRLLDIGCGRNHLVRRYQGFGVGVDVFDWSRGALILRDTSRLPFLDASFDTITILAALNHIPNRTAVLKEARRVLRPDGRLVMTMIPPGLSTLGHKVLWWYGDDWARGMAEGEVYGFTPRQMTAMATAAGFEPALHRRFLYKLNHLFVYRKARTVV
jgi:SAM-dependent methyltransferase